MTNYFNGRVIADGDHIYSAEPDDRSKRPDGRQCIVRIVKGWDGAEAADIARRMADAWNQSLDVQALQTLCNELTANLREVRKERDMLTELRDDLRLQLSTVTVERDEALAALRDAVQFIEYLGHEPSELAVDVLGRHERGGE